MFGSQGKILVGYRWQSNEGKKACERCAALDGKEFYFSPKPGQRSVADMPRVPLHPNCRCSVENIVDYAKVVREQDEWGEGDARQPAEDTPEQEKPLFESSHGVSPRFNKGAKQAFGVNWCNDGRKVWDGPAYGNWGGQNWGGGMNTTGFSMEEMNRLKKKRKLLEPIDKMDEHYQKHDDCYLGARSSSNRAEEEIECDRDLVKRLNSLPDDPNHPKWSINEKNKHVKNEQEKEYARKFRAYATWYFEGRLNWHDVDQLEDETKVE